MCMSFVIVTDVHERANLFYSVYIIVTEWMLCVLMLVDTSGNSKISYLVDEGKKGMLKLFSVTMAKKFSLGQLKYSFLLENC